MDDASKSRDELLYEVRMLHRLLSHAEEDARAFRDLVQKMNCIVLRWDPAGRILFLNEYGQRFFGYREEEVLGRSVMEVIVPERDSAGRDLADMIEDLLRHPERYAANENENVRRDGERVWITWRNLPVLDAEGRLLEIVSTGIDTTDRKRADEALRASEERFRRLSTHDDLTGLHNTRYMYEALRTLTDPHASPGRVALVFMDLDDFKHVVDTHGHLNGGRVIQEVAATIRAALVEPAFGVAYAGDEFVMVLPGFDKARALALAEEVRARVAATTYLAAATREGVRITASFGVAVHPDDAADYESLMTLADQALFAIKRRGKNAVAAG
jgi:two-component system, cell cycle response regulator